MNDWNVGDDAMCLNAEGWYDELGNAGSGPGFMTICKVTRVAIGTFRGAEQVYLSFAGFPKAQYISELFRKVDPLDLSEEDTEAIYHYRKKKDPQRHTHRSTPAFAVGGGR